MSSQLCEKLLNAILDARNLKLFWESTKSTHESTESFVRNLRNIFQCDLLILLVPLDKSYMPIAT